MVLVADEMGEHSVADVGGEFLGEDEHSGLHHQLRGAETAQERGFAAVVGAGDDQQRSPVGGEVAARHARGCRAQRQGDVAQPAAAQPRRVGRVRVRQAVGDRDAVEALSQDQAAEVEGGLLP